MSYVFQKPKSMSLFQQHNSFGLVNHKLYWLDVSDKQRGLLIYIKSHWPFRVLSSSNTANDIQVTPFELNLRKERWMFMSTYR